MQKVLILWLGVALGCHTAPTAVVEAGAPATSEPLPAAVAMLKPATRRPAEITPEIVAKATELLWANDSAKIGTEFPFDLNGKHYVGRVEMHDNPDGDPNRPQGEHKGMTVYVIEE